MPAVDFAESAQQEPLEQSFLSLEAVTAVVQLELPPPLLAVADAVAQQPPLSADDAFAFFFFSPADAETANPTIAANRNRLSLFMRVSAFATVCNRSSNRSRAKILKQAGHDLVRRRPARNKTTLALAAARAQRASASGTPITLSIHGRCASMRVE